MRAVESRLAALIQNGDSGTAALDDFAARCFEQGFDSSPFNIAGDRIGEWRPKFFDACDSLIK
jgi:hypothetical protein